MSVSGGATSVEVTVSQPIARGARFGFQLPVRTKLVPSRSWGAPWESPNFARFQRRQIALFVGIWAHWPMDLWQRVHYIFLNIDETAKQFQLEIRLIPNEVITPDDVAFVLELLQDYLTKELERPITVINESLQSTE